MSEKIGRVALGDAGPAFVLVDVLYFRDSL